MQAADRTRRDWSIALAASVLIHLVMLGFVRFAAVPSANEADVATTIAILRITKHVTYAHGRRGGAAAAPLVSHAKPERRMPAVKIQRRAVAVGSTRATTTADSRPAETAAMQRPAHAAAPSASGSRGAAPAARAEAPGGPTAAPGAEESPEPVPTLTAEMLASLNRRMRDAIPSAPPQTMKLYPTDMRNLAMRPDSTVGLSRTTRCRSGASSPTRSSCASAAKRSRCARFSASARHTSASATWRRSTSTIPTRRKPGRTSARARRHGENSSASCRSRPRHRSRRRRKASSARRPAACAARHTTSGTASIAESLACTRSLQKAATSRRATPVK